MTSCYQLSVFSSSGGGALSKTISRSANGELASKSGGSLYEGRVGRTSVTSLEQLLELLSSLDHSQAVAFGVCQPDEASVVTKARLASRGLSGLPVIARDRDHFTWAEGSGFLLLDYDPLPDRGVLEPERLVAVLREAVPELAHVTIGHKPSTSSCIFDEHGAELSGVRGQHLFIALERAADAPLFGKLISDRLWLAGYGVIVVLANGNMKERCLFDEAVWQPERLIFAAADCHAPLTQRLSATLYPGDVDDLFGCETSLSTGGLRPLSAAESQRVDELKIAGRRSKADEADQHREQWLDERALRSAGENANPTEVQRVKTAMRVALESDELPSDLLLLREDGEAVRAGDLMADPQSWDGRRFADPIDPDYRGDARIAVACLTQTARPHIYSHAHGGMRHYLPELRSSSVDRGRPFEVIPAAVFVDGPPVHWIVKKYLPAACLAMLYGAPASGKSFLAFDLMWAVARGIEWRGNRTKSGRVVYIAAEGANGARLRLRAYAQHHNVNLNALPIGVIAGRPSLHRENPKALVAEIRAAGGADLIVVDTLAQATSGADENSAQDMSAAVAHCNELIELTGATVLLIHHSGKDEGRGARGWSGLKGAVDVEIRVTRGDAYSVADVTKMKDGEPGAAAAFTLQQIVLETDEDGDPVTSCVVTHVDAEESTATPVGKTQSIILAILQELDFTGPFSCGELVQATKDEHLRIHPNSPAPRSDAIKRSIRTMMQKGLVAEGPAGITLPQSHIGPQAADVEILSIPPTPHPSTGGVVGGSVN
jgi:hypothetical protein